MAAWYDIPASEEYLTPLAADDPNRAKYKADENSERIRNGRRKPRESQSRTSAAK